jgi:predicted nucleotidyltransferase
LNPHVFDEFLAEAREDENVIGLVVFGSRGKGAFVDERSDWDVFVVVRDRRGDRPFRHGDRIETVEVTLDELRNQPSWNRYSLAWVEPQLDKTGEVAEALRDAVHVDPASAAEPLDGYINMLYRSLKNERKGIALGALLDAQESIPWYLEFVFAVHGRIRPFNRWLQWELEQHPLPVAVPLDGLERIARTADVDEQRALFRDAETLAREHGLDAVVDGWEPDVAWLRGA